MEADKGSHSVVKKTSSKKFFKRLFCLGSKFLNKDVNGSGNDSGTDSNSSTTTISSELSFKDEIRRSRTAKPSFMTNYTLIDGLQSRTCTKLKSNIGIRSYAGYSKRGFSTSEPQKKNQDAMVMIEDEATNSLIFVCIDGHGVFGDVIADYIQKKIEENLCVHPSFKDDLELAITETIAETENLIYNDETINSDYSGAALTLAVIRDFRITVANVGDSRATIVSRRGNQNRFRSVPISIDHKPETESERERITAAGGRVFPITYPDGFVGPERVWLGDVDAPGLAMSRSIGDKVVHSVGVTSQPEFFEWELKSEDCALVVATDGLWTVFKDEEVGMKAMSCREPASAVGLLLRETHNRWIRSGDTVDDTTICVAYFKVDRPVA